MRDRFRRVLPPGLLPGRRSREEMDEEIEAHLELRVQDLTALGMSTEDARAEALRRFGNLDEARRLLRAGAVRRDGGKRSRDRLATLVSDLRFGWRQALRSPLFTLVAIATLAIGIGLTTATYSLVDRVLIRPLPFFDAERLVILQSVDSTGSAFSAVSSSNWQDWKQQSRAIESTAISMSRVVDLRGSTGALRVPGQMVSGAFFQVIRPRFVAGRSFTDQEIEEGMRPAVISERLWRAQFGADPQLSQPLRMLSGERTIVGVVAAGHEFPEGTDVWYAGRVAPATNGTRNNVNWLAIARLRQGVAIPAARADLDGVAARIRSVDPSALYSFGVGVRNLKDAIVGGARGHLTLLLGAVGFVLLLACCNVAAANVARGTQRSRELAVRAAIGAGRGRLLQQLFLEQILLAAIAGFLGVLLALAGLKGGIALFGDRVPRLSETGLDAGVLVVAALVTLAAAILSGIVPAIVGSRASLSSVLASRSRGATRARRSFAGTALVAGQIAIAVLLLCGALLMIRSFQSLVSRDLGFALNVATVEAGLVSDDFRDNPLRQLAYWDALQAALAEIPEIRRVGVVNSAPLGGGGVSFIEVDGQGVSGPGASFRVASEGYIETLEIPVIAGRTIAHDDAAESEPVAVVNKAMADTYWPGVNPLGRRVRAGSMEGFAGRKIAPWRTVVGVVGNVRQYGLESEPREEMYVPHRQATYWAVGMTAVAQTDAPVERVMPRIEEAARRVDPDVAVAVGSMARRVERSVASRRMTASLLGFFGLMSLLLAALGTYGLLSYMVANRAREMAVRSALGATRGALVGMVVRGASVLIGAGVTLGVAGALALTRLIESQLVDVQRTDPVSFAGSILVIAVVALGAVLIPALRASAADPAMTLRAE